MLLCEDCYSKTDCQLPRTFESVGICESCGKTSVCVDCKTYQQTSGNQVAETLRRFGPMDKDHPSVGEKCPACHQAFKEGDYTALISLGPGSDPRAQERCKEGRPYNAVAVEVHYICATGTV